MQKTQTNGTKELHIKAEKIKHTVSSLKGQIHTQTANTFSECGAKFNYFKIKITNKNIVHMNTKLQHIHIAYTHGIFDKGHLLEVIWSKKKSPPNKTSDCHHYPRYANRNLEEVQSWNH